MGIITCVYLFHELPNDVRRHVVKSFFKHLKPGGLVAFNDSIQLGDRAEVDEKLSLFPKRFHEPFYNDYVKNDVNKLFLAIEVKFYVGSNLSRQLRRISKIKLLSSRK